MNLVFGMDGIICTPCKDYTEVERARPLDNVRDFMLWLKRNDHTITIWCKRPNSLDWVMATKEWLVDNQIPYDRVLFERPHNAVMVNETPPNAKYYKHDNDLSIIAGMFEDWKDDYVARQKS
tara:strand:- start:266 stop:631 length:366 start_codon:yes stop_codon:yes gene_type:complete